MDFAISRNSPDGEIFFPGNGKFFRDRGKSSAVNIPNYLEEDIEAKVYVFCCDTVCMVQMTVIDCNY